MPIPDDPQAAHEKVLDVSAAHLHEIHANEIKPDPDRLRKITELLAEAQNSVHRDVRKRAAYLMDAFSGKLFSAMQPPPRNMIVALFKGQPKPVISLADASLYVRASQNQDIIRLASERILEDADKSRDTDLLAIAQHSMVTKEQKERATQALLQRPSIRENSEVLLSLFHQGLQKPEVSKALLALNLPEEELLKMVELYEVEQSIMIARKILQKPDISDNAAKRLCIFCNDKAIKTEVVTRILSREKRDLSLLVELFIHVSVELKNLILPVILTHPDAKDFFEEAKHVPLSDRNFGGSDRNHQRDMLLQAAKECSDDLVVKAFDMFLSIGPDLDEKTMLLTSKKLWTLRPAEMLAFADSVIEQAKDAPDCLVLENLIVVLPKHRERICVALAQLAAEGNSNAQLHLVRAQNLYPELKKIKLPEKTGNVDSMLRQFGKEKKKPEQE